MHGTQHVWELWIQRITTLRFHSLQTTYTVNTMGIKLLPFGIVRIFKGFYVSIFSVFTTVFLFTCDEPIYILLLFTCALLHETGHIIPLHLFGAKIKRVTIFPFGIDILADTSRISYKKELICTIGGAFFNLAALLPAIPAMRAFPSPALLFFTLSNLALGIFNLIPLPFLDGGRALRLAVLDIFDIALADDIIRAVDIISMFVFSALAFFLAAKSNFNLSIVFIMVYGIVATLGKNKTMP